MLALTDLKLLQYDATTKQKSFVVSYKKDGKGSRLTDVFFGNVEKNDNVFDKDVNANRFCLSAAIGSGVIIHNLYNSDNVLYHSLASRRHRYPYAEKDDYQHIYKAAYGFDLSTRIPDSGIDSIVKVQDTLYGLGLSTEYGHCLVNDEMYSWLAQDNGYQNPKPYLRSICLYDKDYASEATSPNAISAQLVGISCNTLFEIPGNMYTDYSSGSMFATTVRCKNHLDASYSMSHDSSHALMNCRRYSGIYGCNNQLYLKFSDVTSYKANGSPRTKTFSADDLEYEMKFQDIMLTSDVDPTSKVEQIELIQNLNRGATPSNHKSSLYSLRLSSPDLETLQPKSGASDQERKDVENIKVNIRQEVKNMIRDLAERIQPANSQLFSVTVNGK